MGTKGPYASCFKHIKIGVMYLDVCVKFNYNIKEPTCDCFPMDRAVVKHYPWRGAQAEITNDLLLQKKNARNNEMMVTYTCTAI